ncbi:uncharacterized protein F5891DRAFT_1182336 [Suillus fuscotomentosus]|uniref:Uncharacterized protein n=1 Tax=Suillus fuscotomentosus TaxID=1912939 RepID=A0AAD4HQA3_9AGAM|nr:uncharacterized protein F5891DRAFT_1182336 [Suillus fuscotomentosus]KAG1906135.1 hypothetical protein F5891DRAFT_1182336 [Suillus fuscotomentosus]
MSEHAKSSSPNVESSSQTISDSLHLLVRGIQFDQQAVRDCLNIVDRFKWDNIEKGDAALKVQRILQESISALPTLSQVQFKAGFSHFLDLLNRVKEPLEV